MQIHCMAVLVLNRHHIRHMIRRVPHQIPSIHVHFIISHIIIRRPTWAQPQRLKVNTAPVSIWHFDIHSPLKHASIETSCPTSLESNELKTKSVSMMQTIQISKGIIRRFFLRFVWFWTGFSFGNGRSQMLFNCYNREFSTGGKTTKVSTLFWSLRLSWSRV